MSAMFKKILCAIDLDGTAPAALELASAMALQFQAELHVFHVVSMPAPAGGGPLFFELSKERASAARDSIARLANKHLDRVPHEARVEIGDPAPLIAAVARQLPADLVVMATHGRKGFSRFFLGSVAEGVMRRVECPVLTAKCHESDRNTVARWMTPQVITASPDEKLTAVCARMQQSRIRSLPVLDDGKLVGMISDRDVRINLLSLDTVAVRDAMTGKAITLTPQTSIQEAARCLREARVGAMPVMQDSQLVGIIATTDLLEALIELP